MKTDLELETINKLYLELSQFTTAKTKRELDLEELLRSAHAIAERKGEGTAWERFAASIQKAGVGSVTARTYRVLESDESHAMVYLLIEHGDGNDPVRIHICKTELERREKTGIAIFGEQVSADLHPEELATDLQTLAEDKRLEFEGDPPLEWINGYLA